MTIDINGETVYSLSVPVYAMGVLFNDYGFPVRTIRNILCCRGYSVDTKSQHFLLSFGKVR